MDALLSNSLLPGRQQSNNVLTSLMTRISVNPTRLTQWDMNGGRMGVGASVCTDRDRAQLADSPNWYALKNDIAVFSLRIGGKKLH